MCVCVCARVAQEGEQFRGSRRDSGRHTCRAQQPKAPEKPNTHTTRTHAHTHGEGNEQVHQTSWRGRETHINGLEARDCGKVRHWPCSRWSVTRRFVLERGGLRTIVRPARFLWLVVLMRGSSSSCASRPGVMRGSSSSCASCASRPGVGDSLHLALNPTDVFRRRVGLLETGFFTATIRVPSVTQQPGNGSGGRAGGRAGRRAGGGTCVIALRSY